MRTFKRVVVTSVAFIIGSLFIAVWREFVPPSAGGGALMAVIATGIVFGAWKWSERFNRTAREEGAEVSAPVDDGLENNAADSQQPRSCLHCGRLVEPVHGGSARDESECKKCYWKNS